MSLFSKFRFRKFRRNLKELADSLFEGYGYNVFLFNSKSGKQGFIDTTIEGSSRDVAITYNTSNKDLNQAFVNSVFSLYHEREHLQQFLDCQTGNVDDKIFYCHLATNKNKNYYNQNYDKRDYIEFDADKHAVGNSLLYFSQNFPEIDAIESMKTCLKSKKSMYSDWESEIDKIQTIDDFDKYLFEPYEKKLLATRKDRFNTKDDEFNVFLNEHREPLNRCGDLRYDTIFASDDYNNTDCDKFVAAISKELHPEYADFYKNCKAYHDLSLNQIVKDWRKTHKTKAEERAEKTEQQFGYLNERQMKSADDDLDLSDQIDSL